MYKRLLLATDGSAHAARAAEAAIGLMKELPGAEMTIIHVSDEAPSRSELMQAGLDMKAVLEADAHKAIEETERRFQQAEVPFTLKVAFGNPADVIVEWSQKEHADMIIIGSRGLNAVSEVIMGSVSRKVLHHANCPVLVVKR
ncbi:universal stress protein [Paenibacillus sp. J5C_2022]|uniref:universal stress protein n=1 Tax=Paenibacillus sp. J5C2022 TaxID=2977129 RepID=UPI0021CEDB8E|nr:universal stress protein [Paenibacillus sp. J5C2022]MCU6711005.1 universal stress protein [Paenibacillus sp. J5C2022]